MVNATASDTPREGQRLFPAERVTLKRSCIPWAKFPAASSSAKAVPTEKATLTSRLIDRPLRPLFPKGMRNDVQVVATVLSVDTGRAAGNPRDDRRFRRAVRSAISPWAGPIGGGARRAGRWRSSSSIPIEEQRAVSKLSLTVAGTEEAVLMVEAGAKEISEADMLRAILAASRGDQEAGCFPEADCR